MLYLFSFGESASPSLAHFGAMLLWSVGTQQKAWFLQILKLTIANDKQLKNVSVFRSPRILNVVSNSRNLGSTSPSLEEDSYTHSVFSSYDC